MDKKVIILLRISYWFGAIIDFAAGLIMTFPALYGIFNRIPGFTATPDFLNVAGMGAPLMFGWTVLLIWADQKPVERKAVLLITLIPVIGSAISQALGVLKGYNAPEVAIPQWSLQLLLIALFSFSYWIVNKQSKTSSLVKEEK